MKTIDKFHPPLSTSVCVGCLWVHIEWEENGHYGKDQYGAIWKNRSNPVCTDEKIMDAYLDAYNGIMDGVKKMNELRRDIFQSNKK